MKPTGLDGKIEHEYTFDSGGMFESYAGVVRLMNGKFRAFVTSGWGGGVAGKFCDSFDDAVRDIDRLRSRYDL